MSEENVTLAKPLAKMLVYAFWVSQFETRNAAENTVCAFDCADDPYSDFKEHEPDCEFLAHWKELEEVRRAVGCNLEPRVRKP